MHWLSKKKYLIGFTLPTVIDYCLYMMFPIGIAVYFSFTKYSGIGKAKFSGLAELQAAVLRHHFWLAFKNT